MKCLITDAVYAGIEEELKKYMDVKTSDGKPLSKEDMIKEIADVDVMIMRVDPKIDRDIIDAAKNLKVIGVCAVGLNHVDMEYAREKGIQVFNAPGLNANAVAELTISKMLDISRNTIPANHDVKDNHIWDKYKYIGRELRGKTLGIMGFGRIGRRVGELGKAFKMDIVAYDPYLKPEQFEAEGAKGMDVEELICVSDFISIHVPLTPETKNLFNKKSIAQMKDGAVVLNMSRGGIVNEQDMYEALKEGRIGGYAADVLENELAGSGLSGNDEFNNPLFECDNFIITPHLGAQSVDAARDIGVYITEKVKEAMKLH
ncbi:MAG: D-2-hydroxyacid dehydrogenase [Stomatobaculum sp.]